MMGGPGPLGDSGFHRESEEDAQSARRNSTDGREVNLDPDLDSDLEDKPQTPPQVLSRTPVDLDTNRDPLTKQTKVRSERYTFADPPTKPKSYPFSTRHGKIEAKTTTTPKKMKALGAEVEDQSRSTADQWSIQAIKAAFHKKELRKSLLEDPVLPTMQVRQIGDLMGR
ncbi:unnamed protein product [Phytophthora fragariaefolia]|uniref:Unnamed protein product n=1 Tax=Phytophthora fragariaefolia TaxID=1490495 RepID=A0A9W7D1F3_9STRA|nr:unnamed protein product [Phytophthora fragariaefolia]